MKEIALLTTVSPFLFIQHKHRSALECLTYTPLQQKGAEYIGVQLHRRMILSNLYSPGPVQAVMLFAVLTCSCSVYAAADL